MKPDSYAPLCTFLVLVAVFAIASYAAIFNLNDSDRAGGILLLQLAPLLAAFITRIAFQRNLRGLGWAWGKTRYQGAAYTLAFVIPMISFALVWMFGFGGFYNTAFIEEARAGIASMFGLNVASPYAIMIVLVVLGGTLGLFVAIGGIGEELGWRGFLVPELYKHYSFTTTALVSGVIWSVYHWPLLHLLAAPHLEVSPWPLMASVTVAGIGLSTILAWFRLRSGSVWTAVIFHMALNVHTQGFFQNLTTKTSWLTGYISGEYGLMLALVVSPIAVWFWMKRDRIDVGHSNK